MVFSTLGIETSSLWGAAGIVGIATGIAAQGLARDVIRGFSILAANEIRVGDKVEIAGKTGIVEELIVRRVTLRDEDGAVHFVPFGAIQTITNHSLGFCCAVFEIRIPFGADADRALRTVREETEAMREERNYASLMLEPVERLGVDHWTDWSIADPPRVLTPRWITDSPTTSL